MISANQRIQPFLGRRAADAPLDIINMTLYNSPNGVGGFFGVDFCEGSGLWTISGQRSTGQRIYHSSDGVSWILSTYPIDRAFYRPANDGTNSILAAVSTGGNVKSDNQTSWSEMTVPVNFYQFSIYGGGVWLMFRNGDPARSLDRITWSTVSGSGLSFTTGNPCFDGVNFYKAESTNGIYRSTDLGLTWSLSKSGSAIEPYTNVAFGNGFLMAFSNKNQITKSFDNGVTWTTPVLGPLLADINTTTHAMLCYGGGVWIFLAPNTILGNNFFYSRDDGDTWSASPITIPNKLWFDLHYSESQQKFIAVADSTSATDVILEIELG